MKETNAGCLNCIHCSCQGPDEWIHYYLCNKRTEEEFNPLYGRMDTKYLLCADLNKNGDCPEFSQIPPKPPTLSLWTRIKHHFGYG
jgi:hypothetical protein